MLFCASDGKSWRLSQWNVAKKVNQFLYSRYFLLILTLLAVIGHIFAIEMCVYWIYTVIVLYMCLFGRDFLLLLPITFNCYVMPSHLNNPGKHAESIFFMENGAYQFIILAGLILTAAIFRLIFDREIGFRNLPRVKFTLLSGILAVCAAYLLSGIGSENYTEIAARNIRFALLQCVAIFVLYFVLSFTVKWEQCDKRYLCYVLLLMGLLIGIEVLNVFRVNEVLIDGYIDKAKIYVGWGISTNIGMSIVLAIPAALYLAYKSEHVVTYNILAILLCLFTVLTTSRAAVLGAAFAYGCCGIAVCLKGKTKSARWVTLTSMVLFGAVACTVLVTSHMFTYTFANGLQSQDRLDMYGFGLELFSKKPFFGNSFFCLDDYARENGIWQKVEKFAVGFPERWHNTVIQLLACCGIAGIAAYAFHRYQTFKLFFTKRNPEKFFVGISLSLILLLSLVDCHFFNIGPVLVYSAALAFIEGTEDASPAQQTEITCM